MGNECHGRLVALRSAHPTMLQLVLARIIQAGSKLDSQRVLGCIALDLDLDHHDKFVAEPQPSISASDRRLALVIPPCGASRRARTIAGAERRDGCASKDMLTVPRAAPNEPYACPRVGKP